MEKDGSARKRAMHEGKENDEFEPITDPGV